jgi:hypothetical protein
MLFLHPDVDLAELKRLALRGGLRVSKNANEQLILEPNPAYLLPSGARYRSSADTDIRATIARLKLQR